MSVKNFIDKNMDAIMILCFIGAMLMLGFYLAFVSVE
jgi:hypothetical protein